LRGLSPQMCFVHNLHRHGFRVESGAECPIVPLESKPRLLWQ
jgi:hypothetical protein